MAKRGVPRTAPMLVHLAPMARGVEGTDMSVEYDLHLAGDLDPYQVASACASGFGQHVMLERGVDRVTMSLPGNVYVSISRLNGALSSHAAQDWGVAGTVGVHFELDVRAAPSGRRAVSLAARSILDATVEDCILIYCWETVVFRRTAAGLVVNADAGAFEEFVSALPAGARVDSLGRHPQGTTAKG